MSDQLLDIAGLQRFKAKLDEQAAVRTSGDWLYRINPDGTFEAWYFKEKVSLTINNASGNLYRSNLVTLTLPAALTGAGATAIKHASVNAAHNNYPCWGMLASLTATGINYYAMSGGSRSTSPNYLVTAHVFGTIA